MKLFGFWRSTATWRVRIALAHKGIEYEYVPVHLRRNGGEQHRDEFRTMNPMRHVPVLVVDETDPLGCVAESMAILELLEERHPSPPLLPKEPLLRARARQLALYVVTGIQPLQNTKVTQHLKKDLGLDDAAWCRKWIAGGLEALEVLGRETAGRFLVGDELSFADVCLVPQMSKARDLAIDLGPFPTLRAVDEVCTALSAFRAAHADNQPDAERR